MYNGFGGGSHHHGGHFFNPAMMYPQYEPSTIEIITSGDDVCTACRAGTVTGPACDRCPGMKYAGYGAVPDTGSSWLTWFIVAGVSYWLLGWGWKPSRSSWSHRKNVRHQARHLRRKGYRTHITQSGGMYRVHYKKR